MSTPQEDDLGNSDTMGDEVGRVVQMVVTVMIFIVGVTLNSLVVWVLGCRGRRVHGATGGETQGAGSFRVYVVNLAVADLLLLLRTPLMLGYLAHHFSWPFGEPMCHLIMFLRCLGLYAGAFLLSAVAVERCLCLLRPVWARLRRPRWAVPGICTLLWILATALSVPYIHASGTVVLYNQTQCMENLNGGNTLIIMETVAGFLLPLLLFLSCNLAVILAARRTERGMSVMSNHPSSPTSPTFPTGAIYTSSKMTRLYRILFLTMLIFLTCWVPYFTCRFLKALSQAKNWEELSITATKATYVALYLVYIKSALNPIMYVFVARGLRRTLRASLLSTIERVFNEDLSESIRRKSLRRQDSQL